MPAKPAQPRQGQSRAAAGENQEAPARGRGGARKGAGRKPVHGAAVVSRSINLPPEAWAMLDAQRGERSRSEEVMRKILRDDLRGG